jgi:Protein of unknown function (DUF3128)
MGWFSSSKPPAEEAVKSAPSAPINSSPPSSNLRELPKSTPVSLQNDNSAPKRTLTRDEQADADLLMLMRELDAEQTAHSKTRASRLDGSSSTTLSSPDSLYPRTMSCRQAFDSAFYCQSLGGQFNSVYRYGHMTSCSEHWGAFWFCMRSKSLGKTKREEAVSEHYRRRAAALKKGNSSEDIWEGRKEPVLGAFQGGGFGNSGDEREGPVT